MKRSWIKFNKGRSKGRLLLYTRKGKGLSCTGCEKRLQKIACNQTMEIPEYKQLGFHTTCNEGQEQKFEEEREVCCTDI